MLDSQTLYLLLTTTNNFSEIENNDESDSLLKKSEGQHSKEIYSSFSLPFEMSDDDKSFEISKGLENDRESNFIFDKVNSPSSEIKFQSPSGPEAVSEVASAEAKELQPITYKILYSFTGKGKVLLSKSNSSATPHPFPAQLQHTKNGESYDAGELEFAVLEYLKRNDLEKALILSTKEWNLATSSLYSISEIGTLFQDHGHLLMADPIGPRSLSNPSFSHNKTIFASDLLKKIFKIK